MIVSGEAAEALEQHKWRMILAMATLLLCCVATAPCGFLLLNLRQLHALSKSIFLTGVVLALDMGQCWLLLFFTIPTQLKGDWLFGHSACLVQAFFSRVFRGGAYLALVILAVQESRGGPWIKGCNRIVCRSKLLFFLSWMIIGSVSLFPFFVSEAEYTFNVGLSHCDVRSWYIVIHDVITFCIPITLLSLLSIQVFINCRTSRRSCGEIYTDRGSAGRHMTEEDDNDDDDTETVWMTSSHPHEDNGTGRVTSKERGSSEATSTIIVCILCAETALLLMVEWAMRLLGVLAKDPTFLACSVLFCCAGQVVRPSTLIVMKRAYRAFTFSALSSTICKDDQVPVRDQKIVPEANKRPRQDRHQPQQLQRPESSAGRTVDGSCTGTRVSAGGLGGGGGGVSGGHRPVLSLGLGTARVRNTTASRPQTSNVRSSPGGRPGAGPELSGRAALRPRVRPPHYRDTFPSLSSDRSDGMPCLHVEVGAEEEEKEATVGVRGGAAGRGKGRGGGCRRKRKRKGAPALF